MDSTLTLADILRARARIAPYVRRTPLARSAWLSQAAGSPVSLKLETVQLAHSFKARGAFNAVLARLERGMRPARLVTASAGNHGRGLAEAAAAFDLPLVVFTPADAPRAKLDAMSRLGAELRAGRDYDEAERMAKAFASDTGADFISPYSDVDVIAGAGTVAVEMLEDDPALQVLIVPIGGGGLISGVATAAKAINPAIQVVGVEMEASHPFQHSVAAGHLVTIEPGPSLADGLVGNPDPDTITFAFVQRLVDRIVTVSEQDLRAALVGLVEHEHAIAEGAGAAGVAAVLAKRVDPSGRRAAAIVTGANIDRERLVSVLTSG